VPFSFRIGPYIILMVIGTVPVLALFAVAYVMSSKTLVRLIHEDNQSSVQLAKALVERDFVHWQEIIYTHGRFPTLARSVTEGNAERVRERLEIIANGYEGIERVFVTDLEGNLWSDFPVAEESLGRNFSDRDWFRGVTANHQPYVSEVYRRYAEPPVNVVAIAVPVRCPDSGELSGLLVAQLRLDFLTSLLTRVNVVDGGQVVLIDHNGLTAAHPQLGLRENPYRGYTEKASNVRQQGQSQVSNYVDPLTGERMLASADLVQVGGNPWVIIAQQPATRAYSLRNLLALQLSVAGFLMMLAMSSLMFGLVRSFKGTRTLNRELESENRQRQAVEERLRDINLELETHVEERTAELRDAQDRLLQSQKLEAIGALAGGIAHDFNNLLSVIIGYTDLLLRQLPPEDKARGGIQKVHEAGNRAAVLTRQLLAFSRKQALQPESINLNHVINGMREMLERLIEEHIAFEVSFDPELGLVYFDPGQLEQIIMNLVVNARDAMPKGGKLTIETENVFLDEADCRRHPGCRPGPHVVLTVRDTGTGMDAATREKIFEPFFTTKELGRGTGLGLSTVYGIVKQGDGSIWVHSKRDVGTTFKIYLPVTSRPATVAKVSLRTGIVPKPSGVTVLVVEDEEAVRTLIVELLESAGYKVLKAEDGISALRLFDSHQGRVDVLLTDVVLPGMRGPEIAARVTKLRPDIRVMYMSGYTDSAILNHGVTDSGAAFIEKPIRPRELLAKLRETLELEDA
jgi:signal transduction histidine kinase/CheY-like chemotaxis protein